MSDFWADKRVLITGGAGYLAYSLLNLLKDRAASIVRLDRPGAVFFPVHGSACVTDAQLDVRDEGVWENRVEHADVVFHLAAQTSAAKADADPEADWAINVAPVSALIETCRRVRAIPTVLFAGTATECGLTDRLPADETVPDRPVTTYDRHKLMAERELEQADRAGIIRAATLRLCNLYGPGPRSSNADRGILNRMIRRALSGEPLTIYGTGQYMRDYLFVEDAARAFLAAAENAEQVRGAHFVIGSGTGYAIQQALELIARHVADRCATLPVPVVQVDPPAPLAPIEKRNFVAAPALFRRRTGWRVQTDFATGILRTIDYYVHAANDRGPCGGGPGGRSSA
jgi:nucleoside-diphosphate-sugar epimerase